VAVGIKILKCVDECIEEEAIKFYRDKLVVGI